MIQVLSDTGNMTRAAQRLSVSQSALSQQLKDIEGKLATDLFFRTNKKMFPTAVGKRLLHTAKTVLETVVAAEKEIADTVAGEMGTLRIGTQCIYCYKWLPHVMRQFQHQYPKIDVEIGNADDAVEALNNGRFDIVITALPIQVELCVEVPLFEDQLVCVMPPGHPLGDRPFVRLTDFGDHKLISHAENQNNKFYQFVLKPKGIEPKRLMSVAAPHAIVAMVAAGFGLGVFPAWAVTSVLAENGIVSRPITKNGLPLTWRAVHLRHRNTPSHQAAFIQILRRLHLDEIGALPDCPVAV
jgi:LysR family transcriptional regulator for metE and metH